ncbi:MAG: hypothetical protein ACRD5B_11260, partial [Nitrososphaeraceae archaeon]
MIRSKLIEIPEAEYSLQYDLACKEIAKRISEGDESKLTIIPTILRQVSSEFHLKHLPRRHDFLKYLPENCSWRNTLKLRPIKTASGVTVVTVMAMPHPCPQGRCIY